MKNIFIIFSRLIWYMQVPLRTATVKNESKVWILFHALCISCSLYFMLFIFHALWSEEYFWDQWIVQTHVVMFIITIIIVDIIAEIHLKRLLIMFARAPASSYWRHTLCNLLVIANLLIWYCCTFQTFCLLDHLSLLSSGDQRGQIIIRQQSREADYSRAPSHQISFVTQIVCMA